MLIEIIYAFPLLCPGNRSHLKASSNSHFDIAITRLSDLFFDLVVRVNHNVDSYHADRKTQGPPTFPAYSSAHAHPEACHAQSYSAIRAEWEFLTKTLGVDIVVLDTPILDTAQYKDLLGSVITDIVLAVLSFGVQLEVDTKSKAQAEGIAAAHLKGVKFGRPRCTVEGWDTYYPQWKQGQITAVQCYKQLGISASTFYRLVRKYELEDESE